MKVFSHTIQGRRKYQQDALFFNNQRAIVADGMGGHANGELASASFVTEMRDLPFLPTVEAIKEGYYKANTTCISAGDGRGTTGLFASWSGKEITLASAGDSYTWYCNLVELSKYQDYCKPIFSLDADPHSGGLLNAIGFLTYVHFHMALLKPGDVYILATDGVNLEPIEISKMLLKWDKVSNLAQLIVETSYNLRSSDNITCIVLLNE